MFRFLVLITLLSQACAVTWNGAVFPVPGQPDAVRFRMFEPGNETSRSGIQVDNGSWTTSLTSGAYVEVPLNELDMVAAISLTCANIVPQSPFFVEVYDSTGSVPRSSTARYDSNITYLSLGTSATVPLILDLRGGGNFTLRLYWTSSTVDAKVIDIKVSRYEYGYIGRPWKAVKDGPDHQFLSSQATLTSPMQRDSDGSVFATGPDQYNAAGSPHGIASWEFSTTRDETRYCWDDDYMDVCTSNDVNRPSTIGIYGYADASEDNSVFWWFDDLDESDEEMKVMHFAEVENGIGIGAENAMWFYPAFGGSTHGQTLTKGTHKVSIGGRETGFHVLELKMAQFACCGCGPCFRPPCVSDEECGAFQMRGTCVNNAYCDCTYPWTGGMCDEKLDC